MKRWSLAVVWLVVLATATVLTWQIVSAAAAQVNDPPVAPLNVAAPSISQQSTTTVPTTTTPLEPTATTKADATSTTGDPQTTTTSSPAQQSTTTSTPTSESWNTKTVQTQGGIVVLVYRAGEVAYQSGSPAPGYQIEVEKPGPPEVEVELESEEHKVELHAGWHDGELDISVSGEHED